MYLRNTSQSVAYDFLTWICLASASATCPKGHAWYTSLDRGMLRFKCHHRDECKKVDRTDEEMAELLRNTKHIKRERKPKRTYTIRGEY